MAALNIAQNGCFGQSRRRLSSLDGARAHRHDPLPHPRRARPPARCHPRERARPGVVPARLPPRAARQRGRSAARRGPRPQDAAPDGAPAQGQPFRRPPAAARRGEGGPGLAACAATAALAGAVPEQPRRPDRSAHAGLVDEEVRHGSRPASGQAALPLPEALHRHPPARGRRHLRFVQDWLGHSNIQNTVVYTFLTTRGRDGAARRAFLNLPRY